MTPARGSRWVVPATALLLSIIPSQSVAQDASIFEMVVRLRIERGPNQIVFAYGRDSTILIPISQFADLAELRIDTLVPNVIFESTRSPENLKISVETGTRLARKGPEVREFAVNDFFWSESDLFLASDIVAWLYDISPITDWSELQVYISDTQHLPVVRRLAREKRRFYGQPAAIPESAVELFTRRPLVDGAVLDWSLTSSTREPLETSTIQGALGSQVLGGSLDLGVTRFNSPVNGSTSFRYSWIRAWPEQRYVRQLRLGEIGSTGRSRVAIRGGSIGNEPFLRPVAFADEVLAGTFPPGWEVEFYRNDQLIGFTTVDETGVFEVNLPVQYGPNPLIMIGYGPNGEIIERERTFEIPFERLPPNRFEWGVSFGQCQTLCESATNVDLRYGITKRVTVQLGMDAFVRDTLSNLIHPYALASVSTHRSLSFTFEAVANALYSLRSDFAPTPDARATLSQTFYDRSEPVPMVTPFGLSRQTALSAFWRPNVLSGRLFFETQGNLQTGPDRTFSMARGSATYRFATARTSAGMFYQRTRIATIDTDRLGFNATLVAMLNGPTGMLRNVLATLEADVDNRTGLARVLFGLGRQFMPTLRVDASTSWTDNVGASFDISVTTVLPGLRGVSRNRWSETSGVQGTQHAEGSFLYNSAAEQTAFGNGRSLGRGGIAGEVFLDENGNGQRDADEIPVPQIRVRVGSQSVATDEQGKFSVWDIVPFERTAVQIDTLSIANPMWISPTGPGFVYPAPNSYVQVSMPLVPGGEIFGRVEFSDTGTGLIGGTVHLIHQSTGDTTSVITFSDGSFYALGLPPGSYEAHIAPDVLDRLNVGLEPARFEITFGGENVIADIVVRLLRGRP